MAGARPRSSGWGTPWTGRPPTAGCAHTPGRGDAPAHPVPGHPTANLWGVGGNPRRAWRPCKLQTGPGREWIFPISVNEMTLSEAMLFEELLYSFVFMNVCFQFFWVYT